MVPRALASGSNGDIPVLPVGSDGGGPGEVGCLLCRPDPSCVVDFEAPKPELRRRFLHEARRIPPLQRQELSRPLVDQLMVLPALQSARSVALYSPLREEPLLDGLLEWAWARGQQVFLPVVLSAQVMVFRRLRPETGLIPGRMGILEPGTEAEEALPGSLDALVIPALAYDQQGVRLGRGKGYYDRAVPAFRAQAVLIGVCFSWARVERLPRDPWDLAVECVVTETGSYVS